MYLISELTWANLKSTIAQDMGPVRSEGFLVPGRAVECGFNSLSSYPEGNYACYQKRDGGDGVPEHTLKSQASSRSPIGLPKVVASVLSIEYITQNILVRISRSKA